MKAIRKNSQIIIENYEELPQLEKALSLYDFLKKKYVYSAFLKKDNVLVLPGSFPIEEYLPEEDIIDELKPIKGRRVKFKMLNKLRDEQIDLLNELKSDTVSTQKFLSAKTGIGKTIITLTYLNDSKKLPVLIVEGEKIINNWIKEIELHTDIKKEEILVLSGATSVQKVMDSTKEQLKVYKMFIIVHRTLQMMIEKDMSSINKLFLKLSAGIKVIDEAHTEWRNMINLDLLSNVDETLYITSTPYKNDVAENKLYQSIYGNIYKVGLNSKYEEKYHTTCVTRFDSGATKKEISAMSTFYYPFVAQRYTNYLMAPKAYPILYDIIRRITLKHIKYNKKIAFIFNKTDMINKVHDDLCKDILGIDIGIFIAGKGREQLEKLIIFTTDKSFKESIDVKDLASVACTVPIAGEGRLEQIIGRLRNLKDKEVIFYDLVDVSIPDCVRQLNKRYPIYRKICKKIVEVNI